MSSLVTQTGRPEEGSFRRDRSGLGVIESMIEYFSSGEMLMKAIENPIGGPEPVVTVGAVGRSGDGEADSTAALRVPAVASAIAPRFHS